MGEQDIERSEAGISIRRYQAQEWGFQPVEQDAEALSRIDEHLEKHIGGHGLVYHEFVSSLVHIDVHVMSPTDDRNYYTLVTSGMSGRPMNAPDGDPALKYAELLLCLPPDWPLLQPGQVPTNLQDAHYWPIGLLKWLARLPHEYQTWLGVGHTVSNGQPASPYAPNTDLCCALIASPTLFPDEFDELYISDEKTVRFLSVLPIYREEMDYRLKHGTQALFERLIDARVTELLDIHRPNACRV